MCVGVSECGSTDFYMVVFTRLHAMASRIVDGAREDSMNHTAENLCQHVIWEDQQTSEKLLVYSFSVSSISSLRNGCIGGLVESLEAVDKKYLGFIENATSYAESLLKEKAKRVRQLEAQLSDRTSASNESLCELEAARTEVVEVREALRAAVTDTEAALAAKACALRDMTKAIEDRDKAVRDKEKFLEEAEAIRGENAALSARNHAITSELSSLRGELDQVRAELRNTQRQSDESLALMQKLRGSETEQGQTERLNWLMEKSLMEAELETALNEVEELRREIQANPNLADQLREAHTRLEAADFDKREAIMKLEATEREATFLKEEARKQIETLVERAQFFQRLGAEETRTIAALAQEWNAETALDESSSLNGELNRKIEVLMLTLQTRSQQEEALRAQMEEERADVEVLSAKMAEVMSQKDDEMDKLISVNKMLHSTLEQMKASQDSEVELQRANLAEKENSLAERDRILNARKQWMEVEVVKLGEYAATLQSRSKSFSEWQEKALSASKVLQQRMRQLNTKVSQLNRQLAQKGHPLIDLSGDAELETAQQFVTQTPAPEHVPMLNESFKVPSSSSTDRSTPTEMIVM